MVQYSTVVLSIRSSTYIITHFCARLPVMVNCVLYQVDTYERGSGTAFALVCGSVPATWL